MYLNTMLFYLFYQIYILIYLFCIQNRAFQKFILKDYIIRIILPENTETKVDEYLEYIFANFIERNYTIIEETDRTVMLKTEISPESELSNLEKVFGNIVDSEGWEISLTDISTDYLSFVVLFKIVLSTIGIVTMILFFMRLNDHLKNDRYDRIQSVLFHIIFCIISIYLVKHFIFVLDGADKIIQPESFLLQYAKYSIFFLIADLSLSVLCSFFHI